MKVMFVCYGNVGRSQMAKGFYNFFAKTDSAEASGISGKHSYDLSVADIVNSLRQEHPDFANSFFKSMLEKGVDMRDYRRKKLTQDMLSDYDLVVNIAERDQTPAWLAGGGQ
jgi:protein-tyrosine-phosphatase